MASKPTKTTKKPAARASKPSTASTKTKPATKPARKASTSNAAKAAAKKAPPSRSGKATSARKTPPVAAPEPLVPSTANTLLRPNSKQSQLLELLQSKGATIPQMSELTGWQAHTIRATMSAVFRKRLGLTIEVSKAEGGSDRMYRITGQATA